MKVDVALSNVQDAERELAHHLLVVGERHAAEADVYHITHTLAQRCADQIELLSPFGERYGVPDDADGVGEPNSLTAWIRSKGAQITARTSPPGMLLLQDLRDLLLMAYDAEVAWLVLGQVGNAIRERPLLDAVCTGHEHAEMRWKWLRTKIKELCTQVLVASD
jgi:hypothetical protein